MKPRATKSRDVTAEVLRTRHCSLLPASPSGGPIHAALQAAQTLGTPGPQDWDQGPPLQNVGVELHNLNLLAWDLVSEALADLSRLTQTCRSLR